MKYRLPVDVWAATDGQLSQLQPGQWVYAGDKSHKGIWCGITQNGTKVVAWYENAKGFSSFWEYVRTLIQYASRFSHA